MKMVTQEQVEEAKKDWVRRVDVYHETGSDYDASLVDAARLKYVKLRRELGRNPATDGHNQSIK